jgi:hypothetical protein
MNVPYYLTIEKGLVHFGSEVRKISYTHPEHLVRIVQYIRSVYTISGTWNIPGVHQEALRTIRISGGM